MSLDMSIQPPPQETEYGTLHLWNFGNELMRTAIGHGLHAAPWADDRPMPCAC